MAAITITDASVIQGDGAIVESGTAGEAITPGEAVYKSTSDNKFYLADSLAASVTATSQIDNVYGIALNAATANQPVTVQKSGSITVGGTVVVGEPYCLDIVAGQIIAHTEITSGNKIVHLGYAPTAATILLAINRTGITSP